MMDLLWGWLATSVNPMVLASVDASPTDIWQVQRLDPSLVLRHSNGHTFDLTKSWAEFWQVFGNADSGDSCEKIALAVVNGDPIVALDQSLLMPRNGQIERIASFDERVWASVSPMPMGESAAIVYLDEGTRKNRTGKQFN
jgi:hypothetical protein